MPALQNSNISKDRKKLVLMKPSLMKKPSLRMKKPPYGSHPLDSSIETVPLDQ